MSYQEITSKIKTVYLNIRLPFLIIISCTILYFVYPNLVEVFLSKNPYLPIVKTIVDIILMVVIFATTVWASIRLVNLLSSTLQSYAQEANSKVFLLTLPLIENLLKIIVFLWLLYFFTPYFNIPDKHEIILAKILNVITISAISVIIIRSVIGYEKLIVNYYTADITNDIKSRQMYTQIHIMRQVIIFVIALVSLAAIFMVFDSAKEIGISILASAGLISAIVGFAAQKSLANIISYLQLAFTRVIRIGDDIIIDSEFGKVEEITLSYIVVKLWDLRRFVIPISYLNDKPFQNLSRNSSQILGSVFLYVDYSFPVDKAREEFNRIVKASKYWDGEVAVLHVSNTSKDMMELRLLVSASNSPKSWELRCEIREKMLTYIVNNYPNTLAKVRAEVFGTLIAREEAVKH